MSTPQSWTKQHYIIGEQRCSLLAASLIISLGTRSSWSASFVNTLVRRKVTWMTGITKLQYIDWTDFTDFWLLVFLLHDAFVRPNHRATARCSFVCLGRVCIVIIRCKLVYIQAHGWIVPSVWAPWHQSMSTYTQPSFSSSTWKRGGGWINAN